MVEAVTATYVQTKRTGQNQTRANDLHAGDVDTDQVKMERGLTDQFSTHRFGEAF